MLGGCHSKAERHQGVYIEWRQVRTSRCHSPAQLLWLTWFLRCDRAQRDADYRIENVLLICFILFILTKLWCWSMRQHHSRVRHHPQFKSTRSVSSTSGHPSSLANVIVIIIVISSKTSMSLQSEQTGHPACLSLRQAQQQTDSARSLANMPCATLALCSGARILLHSLDH